MYGAFRPASLDEYVLWLNGYVAHRGVPTQYLNCSFLQFGRILYVTGLFSLDAEEGAEARYIIVTAGAKLAPSRRSLGRNVLLFAAFHTSLDKDSAPFHRTSQPAGFALKCPGASYSTYACCTLHLMMIQ